MIIFRRFVHGASGADELSALFLHHLAKLRWGIINFGFQHQPQVLGMKAYRLFHEGKEQAHTAALKCVNHHASGRVVRSVLEIMQNHEISVANFAKLFMTLAVGE